MTKRFITLILVSFIVVLVLPARLAHAHSYAVDGTITVFFHAEPSDRIVAGVPTKLDVSFQDSSNRFEPAKPYTCNCTMTISQGSKKFATLPIDNSNSFEPLKFTFPSSGIYQLRVSGTPQAGATFDPFSAELPIFAHAANENIAPANTNKSLNEAFPLIALTFITIILCLVLLLPKKVADTKK